MHSGWLSLYAPRFRMMEAARVLLTVCQYIFVLIDSDLSIGLSNPSKSSSSYTVKELRWDKGDLLNIIYSKSGAFT